jgi:hypothetical protein
VEIDDSVDSVTEVDVAVGCGVVGWGGKGPIFTCTGERCQLPVVVQA